MDYYDLLKKLSTEELLKRKDDEQYVEEYRLICKKIIEARASGEEQEIYIEEKELEDEIDKEETEREAPESIEECCKIDETTKSLLKWKNNVEKWGSIMLGLIILAGFFISIFNGIFSAETTAEGGNIFGAVSFLSTLLMWIVYAIIEYWVYSTVALVIEALASIVYSNRITANVSLYTAKK